MIWNSVQPSDFIALSIYFSVLDYSFDNIDGGHMLAVSELGFLLEVLLELKLGLCVQLAVALVNRDLVRGPGQNKSYGEDSNDLLWPAWSRCMGVGVICQVPILNWPSGETLFYCHENSNFTNFLSWPDDNVVERDSNGQTQHSERYQPDVGGNLGGVRRGQGHGGDGARGYGDRETRARARLHLLARKTRGATHASALRLVPGPPSSSSFVFLSLIILKPGIQSAAVLGGVVWLVTVTLALARVKHLPGRAVAGGQQTRAPTRRPVMLQVNLPATLKMERLQWKLQASWSSSYERLIPLF